jgi:SPX domain protein involved in polyphosphate accumulation
MLATTRYERKYVTADPAARLTADILAHPGLFSEVYYPRQIVSVYFDTPEYKFYHDNLMGLPQRLKVRLRWYRQPNEEVGQITHPLHLEVKIRLNDLMTKQTLALQQNFGGRRINEEAVRQNLTSLVQASLQTQIPNALSLQPMLLNTYLRRYFYSQYYDVRLTLDDELRFCPITTFASNRGWQRVSSRIVEAKYAPEQDVKMAEIVKYLPLTITKSSKYIMGMQLTATAIT